MSSWPWAWAQELYLHAANGQGELTVPGLMIAAALVVVYFLVNFWSVKVFANTNSAITFFKLIVPAATAIALMCTGFHWRNFQVGIHGGPHVGNFASILTAVATSGIVFSYNGFQSPVNLAGEVRKPGRSVPIAIFGAIGLSAVVYILLQVAFLGAVAPEHLQEGWAGLEYSSPFAQLALALNLNWLAILLYADAFVSPSGTGSTYTARHGTHDLRHGAEPHGAEAFGRVHPRLGIRVRRWFNLLVSFIFLFFSRLGQARRGDLVATSLPFWSYRSAYGLASRTNYTGRCAFPGLRLWPRSPSCSQRSCCSGRAGPIPDHAGADPATAGLSVLPEQDRLAGLPPALQGRVVADCLPGCHHLPVLGRQP
jgi:amino acid transporter